MSYQVIARKYRPQRFADVVGQEHVTRTLANAIRQSRIAHAYLFVGPRGTGKTTLARIFAKCLNCTDGPNVDFADDDPRCREITEGRSLDVMEIDGASNRGIEEIRELRETARYAPAASRFKIYIIDEVHMLTKEAFNALLKTLEEPPAHVKFMFATTEPEKVLPTILSRCQRFDLRRIPSTLIVKHLAHIAGLEKVRIDETALQAIARGADGGMRDAESTLDQLISFCGENIVEADVLSMFGLTAQGQILDLARHLIAGDTDATLRSLNDLSRGGKDLARLLSDLLGHFRNVLIFHVSGGDASLLEVSESELASLKEDASRLDADALTRIMEVLTEGESRLRDAASRRIWVEVTLLKAIQARNTVSIDTVLQRLQQLRSDSEDTSPSIHTPAIRPSTASAHRQTSQSEIPATPRAHSAGTPAPPPEVTPIREESTPAHTPGGSLESLWSGILEAIGRVSAFTRSYLIEAHPVSFEKKTLTIGFDPEFADHLGLVDNPKTRTLVQTKLHELGHDGVTVRFIEAEAPIGRPRPVAPEPVAPEHSPASFNRAESASAAPAPARRETPAPVKFSKEDFKNDALIQKALEIFKGQIVDVRA
ncbi:MAG TPA: DNA polymerase III subunit gamma/tau [Methylomirabilota bacterium]|nr:DNA polymerase III subunit gamma/tau [Methylomirabilota bacterium]